MNWLAAFLLAQTDWKSLRASMRTAEEVPDVIRSLVTAPSPDAARKTYWRLDNFVVVQGRLFQAALPLVPVLLALLSGELLPWAKRLILELLLQIAPGWVDPSELAVGNQGLGAQCRASVSEGKWLYYRVLLADGEEEAESRQYAMDLLVELEVNRDTLVQVLRAVAAREKDDKTRAFALDRLKEVDL